METWNGEPKYYYFYDAEGNLAKKLDEDTKNAVHYEYDSLGRLIHSYQTTENGIVQKTEHLYDTENRIQSQSWQLGSNVYSESYEYDADDGSLSKMQLYRDGSSTAWDTVAFAYDALKRLNTSTNSLYRTKYTYRDITTGTQTTTQVKKLSYTEVNSGDSFSNFDIDYTYDNVGNIETVISSVRTDLNAYYDYDQQGQLISETNNKGSYTYTYDTYGNIRSVSGAESHSYTYGDTNGWYDLLTKYDGHSINYDAIGNPTNWYNTKAWNFTWQNGRQLASASDGTNNIIYTYDVAGVRDSKKVGDTTYNYLTQNGQVVRQTWGSNKLDIIYDNQSRPYALVYNGTTYYYILNLQGDVIRIVDTSGNTIADYVYDAWGKPLNSTSYASSHLYHINPIRYRGYYYDTETGLYYLGSRYYDPLVKRFINADGLASTGQGFVGCNMFAYCLNNPIVMVDAWGEAANNTCLCVADGGSGGKNTTATKAIATTSTSNATTGTTSTNYAITGTNIFGQVREYNYCVESRQNGSYYITGTVSIDSTTINYNFRLGNGVSYVYTDNSFDDIDSSGYVFELASAIYNIATTINPNSMNGRTIVGICWELEAHDDASEMRCSYFRSKGEEAYIGPVYGTGWDKNAMIGESLGTILYGWTVR